LRKLQGRLHAAMELYAEANHYISERDERDARVACPLEVGLGELYYEWNDLETAQRHTQRAIELSQLHGTSSSLVSAYLTQMHIHQARGDSVASQTAFNQAEETMRNSSLVKGIANQVALWRVRRWLAAGDLESAVQWAESLPSDNQDALSLVADQRLAVAHIRWAQGNLSQAIELLKTLVADAKAVRQYEHVIQALILEALVWMADGETELAVQTALEALSLAQPEGYLRTFADEGPPIRGLLTECRSRVEGPVLRAYIDQISSAIPAPAEYAASPAEKATPAYGEKSRSPDVDLVEPLSEREQDVLRLICAGYSNQEIAEELVISLYTVKKHNSHIYGKLGVTSRTQATIRARKLGLD
jgi:LuxR family maltose regulon positive regulatory protein